MESPTTPKKERPRLGARSHTANASLSSPPRVDIPKLEPRKAITADLQEAVTKPRHHRGFFHTAHPDSKGASQATRFHRGRRHDDPAGSKTNLRQQLHAVKPAEGLSHIIGSRTHQKGSNESATQASLHSTLQSQEQLDEEPLMKAPSRPVRPEVVERERETARIRDKELHSSLNALCELASDTTRRLDSAFYSVLEKAGQLHSTIRSLQELSDASNQLYESFKSDTANIEADFEGQIQAFRGFDKQQHEIDDLEARIKKGQNRVEIVNARLEAARKRVELWESREKEWQERTSKRLTFSWVSAAVVVCLIIALVAWRKISSPRHPVGAYIEQEASLPAFIVEDMYRFREKWNHSHPTPASSANMPLPSDERLRALDEL